MLRECLNTRDHPRSRGVYRRNLGRPLESRGSSPLARGLRGAEDLPGFERGIIPARAGFTQGDPGSVVKSQDHPRSRGVYKDWDGADLRAGGSSPLARGLRHVRPDRRPRAGIIPARAGFTWPAPSSVGSRADHPRSRGVYAAAVRRQDPSSGSSPLARGLPIDRDVAGDAGGIIPARAGFTARRPLSNHSCRDHPRSRGVYSRPARLVRWVGGSSPLARGLRLQRERRATSPGIIPARAGFTRSSTGRCEPCRDHPRSRGVYAWASARIRTSAGSSPLARGLRGVQRQGLIGAGIIPARAGFTTPQGAEEVRQRGSSPLARGLLETGATRPGDMRIIPARAGFTSAAGSRRALPRDHPRSRGVYLKPVLHAPET